MRLPDPSGVTAKVTLVALARLDLALDAEALRMLGEAAAWSHEPPDACLARIIRSAIDREHADMMVEKAWAARTADEL